MTHTQYTDLWNDHLAPHTVGIIMPSYNEYLLRENQLEDYLDIFRGVDSRPNREGAITMPYPHPFFNADGSPKLKEKPCVKYLLVGEAAPPLNPVAPTTECLGIVGDKANTYFFDIKHLKQTPYFSSPRTAFNCPNERPCPENKIDALLCLASKGVLLLDLFPFSISYTTALRHVLNTTGITMDFWNNKVNPYSLQNRLKVINALLHPKWDLTLIAPCLISSFILDPINHFPPISIIPIGIHPKTFRHLMPDPTRCGGHEWRKLGVTSAGSPSSHLVSISF